MSTSCMYGLAPAQDMTEADRQAGYAELVMGDTVYQAQNSDGFPSGVHRSVPGGPSEPRSTGQYLPTLIYIPSVIKRH
jgi:hypothetical protein